MVRDGAISRRAREEDVRLAHGSGRDHGGDHATDRRRRDGRGAETAHEDDVESRREGALDAEGEGDALGGGDALGRGQSGKGLDGEGGVGARAGLDEGCGEGVDGVEAERGAVGVRGCDFSQVEPLHGGVEGFGDED